MTSENAHRHRQDSRNPSDAPTSPRNTSVTPENNPDYGGYGEVLRVAIPLILSTASLTLMLFVDRLFLSWHGQSSVAASTPGGITWFTICSLFVGTAGYSNTIVAQHYGAGDKPACARAVWQGIVFSLMAAPVMLTFVPVGHAVLEWAGHGPILVELEKSYFSILMMGGIALPLNAALSSFFSGRGKTRIVMWGNFIGNGANIVLDYILIFGKLGLPEMGIQGAGLASAITLFFPSIFWACLFLGRHNRQEYQSAKELKWDPRLLYMLLRYGLPSGIRFFLDVASFTVFTLLIGRFGEIELAAANIVLSIEILAFLPMQGTAIATATLVGNYIGRRQLGYAEKSVHSALKLATAYSLVFAGTFIIVPDIYLGLFQAGSAGSEMTAVIELSTLLLRIVAFYTVFDNMFIVLSGALTGAGDTRFSMWMQIGLSWLFFVPSIYVVIEYAHLGVVAPWYFLLVYVVLLAGIFYLRFRSGHWKRIRMIEPEGRDKGSKDNT